MCPDLLQHLSPLRGFINVLGMNVSSIGEQPVFLRAVPIWTLGERSVRGEAECTRSGGLLSGIRQRSALRGGNPWRRDLGWRERRSAISATLRLHPIQFRLTDRNRHGLDRAAAIESQLQNLANGTEADLVS